MVFAEVLGVGVEKALVERWRTWFAPSVQTFRTDLLPPEVAWKRAQAVLPDAERLAGTFPTAGGTRANCFGTVMAGTGLDVSDVQIGPETFQDWLDGHTERIVGTGCDDEPGVVFAWSEHGRLAHATVSIGGGWMFGKGSQAWSSPRMVHPVRKVVNSWVYPTARLSRYRISR